MAAANETPKTARKGSPWLLLATGATLVAILLCWTLFWAPLPFIENWWASAPGGTDALHTRHRMADWIILFDRFEGEPRSSVVAVLGEPQPTDYFDSWDMVYRLGAERGFMAIDSEWLVFRFDEEGLVKECRIVRD